MSKRILIVEDNDVERVGMAALLEGEGFAVDSATDGQQALDYLHHTRPNLILLDMLMPQYDGWHFLSNRDPGLAAIPVLVVTGLAVASSSWAEEMGATGLVRKPIHTEQFLDQVRQFAQ
jgi:CheY-like chemotaxis protein